MLTYTVANNILNALIGKTSSVSIASTCYVGLSQTDPGRDGSNLHEPPTSYTYKPTPIYDPETGERLNPDVVAPTGYERQLIGQTSAGSMNKMGTPTRGSVLNEDIIYFPEVLDVSAALDLDPDVYVHPWGEIRYFCIFSGKTGNNLVAYSPIVKLNKQTGEYEETTLLPEVEQLPIIRKNQLKLEIE